jgi:hypothetical protein
MVTDDPPSGAKTLKIECVNANNDVFGGGKIYSPIEERKRQIGPNQSDLKSAWDYVTHFFAVVVSPHVTIMQFLPTRILLRVYHDEEVWRVPVTVEIPLKVMCIPQVDHVRQELANLLNIGILR